MDDATARPPRRWARFSLSTLLLAVLLAASAGALALRWTPWVRVQSFPIQVPDGIESYHGSFEWRIASVQDSPTREHVLITTMWGHIFVWTPGGGEPRFIFTERELHTVRFSEDGQHMIVCLITKGVVYKIDLVSGKRTDLFAVEREGDYRTYVLGSARRVLVCDWTTREATLHDIPTRMTLMRTNADYGAFSADEKTLYTFEYKHNSSIEAWDAQSGEHLKRVAELEELDFDGITKIAPDWSAVKIAGSGWLLLDLKTGELSRDDAEFRDFSLPFLAPDRPWVVGISRADSKNLLIHDRKSQRTRTVTCENPVNSSVSISKSGDRVVALESRALKGAALLFDLETGALLWRHSPSEGCSICAFIGEDDLAVVQHFGNLELWRRQRPEWWWGIAYLPEAWLTLLFALALGWRLVRRARGADRKRP